MSQTIFVGGIPDTDREAALDTAEEPAAYNPFAAGSGLLSQTNFGNVLLPPSRRPGERANQRAGTPRPVRRQGAFLAPSVQAGSWISERLPNLGMLQV